MEFLKVNGIEIAPTEDNIVTVVKNILKNFTSDEAESLKNRIQNAESIVELPNAFFLEDNCLVLISLTETDYMISIDGKNGGKVDYLRELK